MSILRWIDRNLWSVPLSATFLSFATMLIWELIDSTPTLLAGAKMSARQQVHSSLASSSGSLLGFTIAAVTILAAFMPRNASGKVNIATEKNLAKSRNLIIGTLLTTAALLMMVLVFSTILLASDQADIAPTVLIMINLACAFGAAIGLLTGGAGLALAVVERNRL
ncbi:hypothetical protein [Lentzea fradiae]|uniref:hypothetical protein n=1 Tax=Lentzea fradiae TaxID=200378 RepID=UPI00115F9F33|nr:hypothetical protein [Lentzea fradiae]